MSKRTQTSFVCQECGYDSSQWLGKCPQCGQWNSFKEIHFLNSAKFKEPKLIDSNFLIPQKLTSIISSTNDRIQTGFKEMDVVMGGGIVTGSVTLIAGDPGIGKSTLLLQICIAIATQKKKVLYVSGEESAEQIKMRATRLNNDKTLDNLFVLAFSNADSIPVVIEKEKPDIVIIDSIQTMDSGNVAGLSGSVGQIRYAASLFIRTAKSLNIPFILVGHVTKEGMVAGPMLLSHMVDTVLFLEGEKFTTTRILRSLKNRFGPVDEVGIFIMDEKGMQEVKNPEQVFLAENKENVPGSALVVIMEGSRPFLVEIQALVISSKFPMPKRVASGLDSKRLELLLAVLQKHCQLPLQSLDVYVNIAGGLKIEDPAADLSICLAVYASLRSIALSRTVGLAEISLLGSLRRVSSLDKRINQAKKLGFTKIITPQNHTSLKEVLKSLE